MKTQISRTISLLGLLVVLAAAAQAQSGERIKASIPFDFNAGQAELKAGDYTMTRVSDASVLLRSEDGKAEAIVSAPLKFTDSAAKGSARVVFNRYGSEYFLAQVWTRADSGCQLNMAGAETRAADRLARSGGKPERVQIAAR